MAMTAIKILKGTFGYWDGTRVVPKTAKDEPFLVETGRAKELVERGVAEFVNVTAEVDGEQYEVDGEQSEVETDDDADLEEMTINELKEYAEPYGVKWKVGMKKEELIEAIKAAQAEVEAADDADDEEDEEAPKFNAEDAVQ